MWTLRRGDAIRWTRTTELVAWAAWMICCCMPFSNLPDTARDFHRFLRMYTPPGFVPPNQRD